jgi:hypothetical protein
MSAETLIRTDDYDVELWRDPDTGATAVAYLWRRGSVRGIRVIDVPSGRVSTMFFVKAADGSTVFIDADHEHRIRHLDVIEEYDSSEPPASGVPRSAG